MVLHEAKRGFAVVETAHHGRSHAGGISLVDKTVANGDHRNAAIEQRAD
jgi:hypothetical protein